jgi:hypothetical protein
MEGSAIAPPRRVQRQGYLILTIIMGIAGSFVAMAAFAHGTYRVGPMIVKMEAFPATSGTTELAVEPISGAPLIKPGHAKATTHTGFLGFRGTVVGVYGDAFVPLAAKAVADPKSLADSIKADGKSAGKKFGLRVGLVVLGGGGAGGFAVALLGLRARRIFQGAISGVVVVAILGVLAWQTYDIDKFKTVQFNSPSAAGVNGLPPARVGPIAAR